MRQEPTPLLRFVSSPYSNQLPLAHFIPSIAPHARLETTEQPSTVLALLDSGAADAVLLPVAALASRPDLVVIDGLGVCALQKVRSVLLKCRVPLRDVRTVEEDPASLSSNTLTRVLFQNLWRTPLHLVKAGALPETDAKVMIGDHALCAPTAASGDIDLAAAWHELTGLPFVFAVWVHRLGHPHAEALADIAHASKRKGVAELPMLARLMSQRLGLDEAESLDYLTTCIYFDVGKPEQEAIKRFLRMAADCPIAT
jgi:chorismate dehydratase